MVATMKKCWICRTGLDPARPRGYLYDMHEVCAECRDELLKLPDPRVVEIPLSPSSMAPPGISILMRERPALRHWGRRYEVLIAVLVILAGVGGWELMRAWLSR